MRSTAVHARRELESLKADLDRVLELQPKAATLEERVGPDESGYRLSTEPRLDTTTDAPLHLSFESALRALRPQIAELRTSGRRIYDQRPAPEIHVVASRVIET